MRRPWSRATLAAAALVLIGCGTSPPYVEPGPSVSLTVLQAGPIEALQCEVYEVCFLYYRVVVEVELAQDEPIEVTAFTVTTPHWPWPTEARQTIQQGVYAPNGPYESGCDGARCEVYWGLKSWHRESNFYPAVVAYADAEVIISGPVP